MKPLHGIELQSQQGVETDKTERYSLEEHPHPVELLLFPLEC